jgi:transcriptional regulator with XRE-family HTH domain
MSITPVQSKMARAALGWTQAELARKSQTARKTISDFELELGTPKPRTLRDVVITFQEAGVVFIDADEMGGLGPGVRLAETPPVG